MIIHQTKWKVMNLTSWCYLRCIVSIEMQLTSVLINRKVETVSGMNLSAFPKKFAIRNNKISIQTSLLTVKGHKQTSDYVKADAFRLPSVKCWYHVLSKMFIIRYASNICYFISIRKLTVPSDLINDELLYFLSIRWVCFIVYCLNF